MYDVKIEYRSGPREDMDKLFVFKDKPFSFILELVTNYTAICNNNMNFSTIKIQVDYKSKSEYCEFYVVFDIIVDESRNYICSFFFNANVVPIKDIHQTTIGYMKESPNKKDIRYQNISKQQLIDLLKERCSYD